MQRRGHVLTALVGVVAICVLASACTSHAPAAPVLAPTVAASPPESDQEREERLAYEAAEQAYDVYLAEMNRLLAEGGASKPTKVLANSTGGNFYEDADSLLQSYKDTGDRIVGTSRTVYVHRQGYSPTELGLLTCDDGTRIRTLNDKGKVIGRGNAATSTLRVKRVEQRWKVWSAKIKVVSSCSE